MKLQRLNGTKEFEEKITKSTGISVVDFGADWCAPCRALDPVLFDLSETLKGKAEVYRVDVDQHPELAANFNVRSLPTVIIFKDGALREKLIGYQPRSSYLSAITGQNTLATNPQEVRKS